MRAGAALAALALTPSAADAGEMLDRVFPRGVKLCYAKADQGRVRLLRLTRPVRVNKFDGSESRHVRAVVNFTTPRGGRFEGGFSCTEEGGKLNCRSDLCDAGGFVLFPADRRGLILSHGRQEGQTLWACSEKAEIAIEPDETERRLTLRRGRGTCL